MKELLAEAIRLAVNMERNSEMLYRRGAMAATELMQKTFFERLAQEESRHIEALLQQLPHREAREIDPGGPQVRVPAAMERSAAPGNHLHQALLDKRFSIDLYATFCRCFKEPALCRFFDAALAVARREFKQITAEYLKGGRTEVAAASPPRRSHQRGELPQRLPNRHTQLFFAMQDCGRQSRIG
ncbi:ferritin [Geomonas propionica]|uniref:Ferritin n=1 Tax=Geomonas propionica TaxID=2798582 RepID=A0ABS0YQV2_9BACT|nr:ferritin [Geomonas propionica]MBJ6799852.1 ferritin [Geomonas propionica]